VSLNYYKKPQTKSQLVIFAGGLPMGTRNQLTAEAAIRLSYPQISKNIFFNVGLHYSHTLKTRVDRDNGNFKFTRSIKDDIFGVPVTLQYNLSNWIIKPYISGGVGFNYLKEFTSNDPNPNSTYIAPKNQFNISPIACIGIEGYVTQKLFIKAEWRYEILLQYPAIGIAYLF
jgi:opacity protein-like surface antigen